MHSVSHLNSTEQCDRNLLKTKFIFARKLTAHWPFERRKSTKTIREREKKKAQKSKCKSKAPEQKTFSQRTGQSQSVQLKQSEFCCIPNASFDRLHSLRSLFVWFSVFIVANNHKVLYLSHHSAAQMIFSFHLSVRLHSLVIVFRHFCASLVLFCSLKGIKSIQLENELMHHKFRLKLQSFFFCLSTHRTRKQWKKRDLVEWKEMIEEKKKTDILPHISTSQYLFRLYFKSISSRTCCKRVKDETLFRTKTGAIKTKWKRTDANLSTSVAKRGIRATHEVKRRNNNCERERIDTASRKKRQQNVKKK